MTLATARRSLSPSRESGVTLIEVIIAMMVFGFIAVSVAFGLITALGMGGDTRSRAVAINLAAQDIDTVRATRDVFGILNVINQTTVVNGTTFHLTRTATWETSGSAYAGCGSGGGQLKYKRLNVTVDWDGRRPSSPIVRSATVISPGSRINDPALGSILVSVLTGSGAGSGGITVTATPSSPANGALPITVAPLPTDAQGCSYILKVTPGNYDVSLSRTNYLDEKQAVVSTKSVGVAAGAAASVAFQYDLAGKFDVTYAGNYAGVTRIPTDMHTTFRSTYGVFTSPATTSSLTRTVPLHPFAAGYEVIAGQYNEPGTSVVGCLSVDPAAWTTVAADGAYGRDPSPVAALPGATAVTPVPMGVLNVAGVAGTYLKAVSQASAPGTGDPGCAETVTYSFGLISAAAVQIGLPYGSWRFTTSSTATGSGSPVPAAGLTVLTRGVSAGGLVTLDPRRTTP
ncbi:type II secretion system protein [Cryobacterium melibiosiphilum]|uniref:Type II secretion system protein n=1 Tax=Cryobacterium melibiosiphilum TaxID=995039 RepID=A0A3A5MN18_9MICO|nr:type II secretion system protein [Cryobacterium melibiosiphilum]RJT88528.1 type II secretion system protein [Cryobacterium melibiosiphilum]